MQDLPKVSINIPTYGQAHYIERAIESALAQDYPNLEVIVADDCSPDNTSEVIKKYANDTRFKYYRNRNNLGRIKNYKKCLYEYATGEWVINCDGDDYYINEHFISEVMDQVAAHDDVVFAQAGHQIRFVGINKDPINSLPNIPNEVRVYKKKEYFLHFREIAHFSHMTTIYRRESAISIDFYRYNISSTDIESFLRLSLHGNALLIKKVYGAWVQHGKNFSQNLDYEEKVKNLSSILEPYRYASSFLPATQLKQWRRKRLTFYFRDWLSKTAKSKASVYEKINSIALIMAFAWRNHRSIYSSLSLYVTIFSLPYKLLKCVG